MSQHSKDKPSGLSRLFSGKKKKEPEPTPQDALEKLQDAETLLVKKQQFLEHKINQEVAAARKHSKANRPMALRALKRKHLYECQLQKIDGTISTLEFQREALDNAATNSHVLGVMGDAARAIKEANIVQNVDQVYDIMEDIQEQQEVAQGITDAISNPANLPMSHQYDEDELLAELEQLEREEHMSNDMARVRLDNNTADLRLPSVPVTPLPSSSSSSRERQPQQHQQQRHQHRRVAEEDREYRDLESWSTAL